MKTQLDIAYVIANLVRQTMPDLDSRFEEQKISLLANKCSAPLLGIWLDASGAEYLLSMFALDDKDFKAEFPEAVNISRYQRQQISLAIQEHVGKCPHCSIRHSHDIELDKEIEEECRKNTDFLLRLLDNDKDVSSPVA